MYRPQSREEFRRQQEQRKRIRADLRALSRVTTLIIFGGIIARIAFIMFDKLTSRAGLPGGEMFLPLYVIALPYFGWKLRAWCHPEKPRRKIKRKETYKCTTTFCPACGCSLDPGERCDCRENNAEQPTHKLVTYADWEAAGSFEEAASPGDYVEERIVDEMRDCLPPAFMSFGFLQTGEPYSHELDPDTGKWRPTFATFKKDGQHWTYCGNCFYKQDTPPKSERRH